ncbi:polysaccharide biosynthesis protein [Legionella longbeachae]|uniref:Putative nucleoside-diphosphate sugar epimerases n=1 Tax=Legionella longbeachae serogroup 1 (strain NSW150) TaxID=661367 RepID=D3HQW4_LEGLN|nr:nucleoside-diphosphate sugar epimerase/dehydratase [Legionella longbeachae]VEE01798.1 nucleoside-diphosphate sugar epimerases [Legionella oakridgensis]HBD7396549.1 polysaccharide biosynthesis protein [Legionella pneumophila]ARB91877.1 polysaccharide biosynthesis protein [Legionella longbeachae]EEZ95601.1 polysaccharide biosynthesis protein [Legionella longbeachae D-4968]QIN31716.1 NAD-dependent epimerase/dehydratase family protein [Legionella longbeachae]
MIEIVKIFLKRLYIKSPVLLNDLLAIPLAWYAAYWLRYNLQPFPDRFTSTHSFYALALLTVIQLTCYFYFKTYRGLWRFFSLNDVIRILKASVTATTIAIPVLYLTSILHELPRSIFPLYCVILTAFLCSARLLRRLYWDRRARGSKTTEMKRVLIVGAGMAGEGLVRDLKRSNQYKPIGFIDDNLSKKGLEVHGVPVLGVTSQITMRVKEYAIDLIFIAIPSASSSIMRRIVTACESSKVPFSTLPGLNDLAAGRVEVNALRPVNIEDLLGREQVYLQWDKLIAEISEKRVLVTGGGGSIGSELCRQILALKPQSLVIVENSEFNLYQIELELKQNFPDIPLQLKLVNITDEIAINQLFNEYSPEIVFHAAAYKHVPLLENQIRVAVVNNILGTQIVAKASVAAHTEKFILISTDKAVNPTNIMGTTKRVAEIFCQNLDSRVKTQFITVRFGNVLGSAGSVVPLFQKQLQNGGPIKVTHPDMQRYFMTIPEACQLILQAMVNGKGGEIFVLDMGEPVKISYLAEQMIRLAGKEPGKDIMIEYTGLRPGEKLFEELFHESEQLESTEHEKLFKAKFRELNWDELMQTMHLLNNACMENQEDELLILLRSLVPELHATVLDKVFN